jgi:hypothetical protein
LQFAQSDKSDPSVRQIICIFQRSYDARYIYSSAWMNFVLHPLSLGLKEAVREIRRIIRCGQKYSWEGPGVQLGSGLREAHATIQSGDHLLRPSLLNDIDHLLIQRVVCFFPIASHPAGPKSPLGALEE